MPFILGLLAVLSLALPGTALAQSAGDDQYADPFEEERVQGSPAPRPKAPPRAPTRVAERPAVAEAPAPRASSASTDRLAYTGLDLPLLFVTGAVMLLSGFTVRRAVAGPYAPPR